MLKECKQYSEEEKRLYEGLAYNVDKNVEDLKVLEVSPKVSKDSKVSKDDKQSFEDFKTLYDSKIKDKCLADYGTLDDKKLLEDTAKELYLQSKTFVPEEETKVEGDLDDKLEEGKTIKKEDLDIVHYKLGQLDKVDGDVDDEYTIKISNRTKGTETKYLNVNKDIINTLKSYFENAGEDKVEECDKLNESEDNEFNYQLLDRLRTDCEYFLGNGNRNVKHLWAGNVEDQIAKMKELYNTLPEKPDWITMEDIENYEKEMKA